jgi:hypothetical protein
LFFSWLNLIFTLASMLSTHSSISLSFSLIIDSWLSKSCSVSLNYFLRFFLDPLM